MALHRTIGSLALEPPIRRPHADLSLFRRPFAAPPPQVKRKSRDDDDAAGPRINKDITAPFLRLVTDQGHNVVPRHEALQLAARMDMDLVEVHRKSDPPVCKIMDFHKEKYKKDAKEKERLKTKSAIVLRGGENKEVRFKGKTVKADAISRLMERGYRVKCMAMPSGNEEEDLGGPLSRLLGLIQDICIVESGPHLDSKHAYVIVRHVKFATKKAGKKASKAMEDAGKGTRDTFSELPVAAADSGDNTTECGLEVEDGAISDHFDKIPPFLWGESSAQKEGSRINPGLWGSQTSEHGLSSKDAKPNMEKREKTNQDMAPWETNRYANRRQQIKEENQGLSQGRSPQDPRRKGNEGRYQVNDNQRPPQPQQHNRPLPRFNQGTVPQDPRRNERGSHIPLKNNQRQFQPLNQPAEPAAGGGGNPTPTSKSFGIFSTPKPATSELRKTNSACTIKPANLDVPKSYGIFSTPRRESDDTSS